MDTPSVVSLIQQLLWVGFGAFIVAPTVVVTTVVVCGTRSFDRWRERQARERLWQWEVRRLELGGGR